MQKIISFIFLTLLMVACKNDAKSTQSKEVKTNDMTTITKKDKKKKVVTGLVEAQIDGKPFKMDNFDQKITTDVVFLDNGIQFRINDVNEQMILVNMYAPDLLKHIPIAISQQSSALKAGEAYKVKTHSRLEVIVPSGKHLQSDSKALYQGTVSLDELSENRLVVTFNGMGFSLGSTLKKELFPMQGKIILDSFNVYDFRTQ